MLAKLLCEAIFCILGEQILPFEQLVHTVKVCKIAKKRNMPHKIKKCPQIVLQVPHIINKMQKNQKILFLDKVLLAPLKKPVRGVELFNINLLRDLSQIGYNITLPLHNSWIEYLKANKKDEIEKINIISCSKGKSALTNGMSAILQLKKEHFDTILLANIANSLIPAIKTAKILHLADKFVLIAHREPSRRFLHTCNTLVNMTVVAVNNKIAGHFDKNKYHTAKTWYGITNADKYYPPPCTDRSKLPFRFCVLGQLDNAWKGADTAVDAFYKLPTTTMNKCELHLASFTKIPEYPEKNIIPYGWMDAAEIPNFLRSMDAIIVPSRDEVVMRETFSQVIVQGMLTALPVCASNLPILTEKLDKGGGLIFNDTDELANQMQQLAEDRASAKKMGAIAKSIAEERYIWKSDKFAKLFLE